MSIIFVWFYFQSSHVAQITRVKVQKRMHARECACGHNCGKGTKIPFKDLGIIPRHHLLNRREPSTINDLITVPSF